MTRSSKGENIVRTVTHVHHFPDLPFGEITIEGTSTHKHCVHHTAATKKNPRLKMGLEKEVRALFKNVISVVKQPKKDPILRRGGRECTYCIPCVLLS